MGNEGQINHHHLRITNDAVACSAAAVHAAATCARTGHIQHHQRNRVSGALHCHHHSF